MVYDASFWVLISFLLFFAVVGRRFFKKIIVQLDDRAHRISQQLREAADLHEETEHSCLKARSALKKQKTVHERHLKDTQKKISAIQKETLKKMEELEKELLQTIETKKKYLLGIREQELEKKFLKNMLKKVESSLKNKLTAKDKKQYILDQLK
ncbi:MAG: hypothetical protein WCG05_01565 [Alphaproteobacteria bacterium]